MIEIITSLPEHVAAFRATGRVTKDDYRKIIEWEVFKKVEIEFVLFVYLVAHDDMKLNIV